MPRFFKLRPRTTANVRPATKPILHLVALEPRDVPATFTVTSVSDFDTAGVDLTTGKLAAFGNVVTLRSAILASNATAGIDDVVVPAGTYTLSVGGSNEDVGITGDLDINDSVNIEVREQSSMPRV